MDPKAICRGKFQKEKKKKNGKCTASNDTRTATRAEEGRNGVGKNTSLSTRECCASDCDAPERNNGTGLLRYCITVLLPLLYLHTVPNLDRARYKPCSRRAYLPNIRHLLLLLCGF